MGYAPPAGPITGQTSDIGPTSTSISAGAWPASADRSAASRSAGRVDALGGDVERAGECDEVRIHQVAGDHATGEHPLLGAFDVAVGAVVEDDRHDIQAVLSLGGQLGDGVQVPAIAGDGQHRPLGIADLRAERGGKGRAERALIARAR